ncbi:hypothetical protein KP509_37G063400 [Ceratopteris richardii]|uniref:Leucine-rich repeat-containing protein 45 n=2 Tax=Ceratopteris richardii TaxID=49495 RepID=A0A8T2Q9M0_CERRI|nr:hypothetical protein KP509_37G063400 [Ceratopteris richardii]
MAAALAHALRNNCSLTSLDLRWNEIGAAGATALIGMLERNRVLTELQLAGNNIPPNLQAEIDRLLERNRAGMLEEGNLGVMSHHHRSYGSQSDDDIYQHGRRAHLQYDLSRLKDNLDSLKEECQSLQLQQETTNTQLESVKHELREESRLRLHAQKEGQEFKEQALKAREDINSLQDKFFNDANEQTRILMEARDMQAAAMTKCEALQDEILRLREEHSSELQDLAERARKEADYSLGMMNRMENTLHEHDHMYMAEINKLHMRLSEETQEKEDALREMERQRSLALSAEENWLREKDAHEQALKHMASITSEMQSLEIEVEKLTKQLSKLKKSHAGEVEELEKLIFYHKDVAARADQEKADFTAERKQLLENIKLLEEKGRVLEKKLELERLQYSEALQNEMMKCKEDRRIWEQELENARSIAEANERRIREMQAEQEQRMLDQERKLNEAETLLSKTIQQQFIDIRSSTGGTTGFIKYPKY